MHKKRIRRGTPRFESSDSSHQAPHPELFKHPMTLSASQSPRKSTRYPRDSKPIPGGNPPGPGFMSRGYRVDSREDCEASRLIGCLKSPGFGSKTPPLTPSDRGGSPAQSRTPHVPPPTRGGDARNEKIDIQSKVLIGPFSTKIQTRNGREIAIRPTKNRSD